MAWIFLVCVGFGHLIGLFIGGMGGFMAGYDWAIADMARLGDRPVTAEEMAAEKEAEAL